ncbi:Alpha/Beta hydrolase protein [Usnea florida]
MLPSTLILFFNLLVCAAHGLSTLSPGCNITLNPETPIPGGPSIPLTISVPTAGGLRTYLLSLPKDPTQSPSSLILAFHGKDQTAAQFETQTQLTHPAFRPRNSIIAFPQGIGEQWLGDPASPPRSELDDIAFVRALLKELGEERCVDLTKIYLVGFSNGGGLTNLLACDPEVSKQVAAAAIVSGAFYKDHSLKGNEPLFGICEKREAPLPMLEMHGSADPVIHYDGKSTPDGETYSLQEWLGTWRKRNGCAGAQSELRRDIHDASVQKTEWRCGMGKEGAKEVVIHYYIRDFGHGWPSTKAQDDDRQRLGPVRWNATSDIAEYLTGKRLDVEGETGKGPEGAKDEL